MSKKKVKLSIGMRVKVVHDGGNPAGTIKFIGKTKFATGSWVGVALDEAKGKNDGTIGKVKYFDCQAGYGLMAKPAMIKPLNEKGKKGGKNDKKSKKKDKKAGKKDKKDKPKKGSVKTGKKDKKDKSAKSAAQEAKVDALKAAKESVTAPVSRADNNQLDALRTQITSLESKLADKSSENRQLKSQLDEAKKAPKAAKPSKSSGGGGDSAEVESLKNQLTKLELEKEEAVLTLEGEVEELKVDKELADEQVGGLEEELEIMTQDLEDLKLDLETMEIEKEAWTETLSPDAQGQQAVAEENRKLTAALRALKTKYDSESEDATQFKEEALEKLSKFTDMTDQIIALTDELADEKEKVGELQESLDEAGGNEEEIESLSEQNLTLDSQIKELNGKIEYLEQMKEANEEIIEQQEEMTSQVQADLDQKEMEVDELNAQLSLKLKQIEDLHQTQRKFKDHVKHLEAEVSEVRRNMSQQEGDASAGDVQMRVTRKANMQLQARVSEVRGKSVDYVRAKIDKEEYASKVRFYEMHIPDNLEVNQAASDLILTLDRLKGKSVESANLLGEFYGKETHNETLAANTYDMCGKLIDLAKNIGTLRRCIEKCDDDEVFAVVVGERKMLKGPEDCIDELLTLISRDEFDVDFNKEGLSDAQENIVGFVAAHFMTDEDDRGNRRLKTSSPLTIMLDVRKLSFQQELLGTYFQCLSDLFDMVPKPAEGEKNGFEEMFEKMMRINVGNNEILRSMRNEAQSYQLTCENRSNASNASFAIGLKTCEQAVFGCGVRVKEILETFNSLFSRSPPDESNREYFVGEISRRLDQEALEDRLVARLTATQENLKELSDKIQNIPDADHSSSQKSIPLWEQNAHQVRQEIFESASLKTALEEAQSKVEERDRALFKARKEGQDKQARIDVMKARWITASSKMGEQGEMEQEVVKLRKRVIQQQEASDVLVKDLGKYQSKNKVLRQKVLKLKVELKAARVNGGGGGGVMGEGMSVLSGKSVNSLKMATHEIDLLVRTISSMRHQLAQVRCANITRNLNASLPLLPVIWGGAHTVHSSESSSVESNTAVQNLKSFIPSPFYGNTKGDAQITQNLSRDLGTLSAAVNDFRATPLLVDVSKYGVESKEAKPISAGQMWLSRQEAAQKLKDDSVDFNKRLQIFLDSKRSYAFRSLFSSLAAPESAVLGGGGQLGQLVGKVTVPSVNPGGNHNVAVDRNQLSQLHSILVN